MDKAEATKILSAHLAEYRTRSFAELARLVADHDIRCVNAAGETGTNYQIEIQCLWDSEPGGAIRVIGTVDDGGWRAFVPITDDFVVQPGDRATEPE